MDLVKSRVFVVVGLGAVLSASALARPDLNAFLNRKADTTAELVAQAKRDPAVMDRYMRHFGMTRTEVIEYLNTLHPDTLRQEGIYAIYSVPEGGRIKMHVKKLDKGSKVFAGSDGNPQLIMLCGNPLTLGPKQVVALNKTPVTTEITTAEDVPQEIVTDIETEFEPVAMVTPTEPTYTFTTTTNNPIPFPLGGGGFNPLPLALGGLAFTNGGGGSAVPEPMTMLVFGGGVAAVAAMKRRRSAK
jgi:hypothetical protein